MVQLYCDGYSNYAPRFTIEQCKARHPGMETEFGERYWAAQVAAEGLIGVGGGWREDPPPGVPGFAPPNMSFHEWQTWRDRQRAWAAVDIVGVNARHGAAQLWLRNNGTRFGLLTFWNVNNEPWHVQADDIPRGFTAWVAAGRPNPNPNFVIPGGPIIPVPPTPPVIIRPPIEVGTMLAADPERRLIDTRLKGGPSTLFAVPTGLDPKVVRAVDATVTVIPQGKSGFMSVTPGTSFLNYGNTDPIANTRMFKLNADGTISIGASTTVHVIVDLVGEYH